MSSVKTQLTLDNDSLSLLIDSAPEEVRQLNPQEPLPKIVLSAIEIMAVNISTKLDTDLLAQKLGSSSDELDSLFKDYFGTHTKGWFSQYQIEKSKQLLLETDLPLNTISERFGFSNTGEYCEAFKSHIGITPTQYRNIMLKAQQ